MSALCAEYCRAQRIIYSTNVDGVYTADPIKHAATARKLVKVSYDKLRELCCGNENTLPGQYRIMDGVALTILERSRLEAVVLEGKRDEIVRAVLRDLAAVSAASRDCGTTICDVTLEEDGARRRPPPPSPRADDAQRARVADRRRRRAPTIRDEHARAQLALASRAAARTPDGR